MKNTQRLFITTAFCALVSCASATASSYYKTGAVLGTGLGYSTLSSKATDTLFYDGIPNSSGSFKKTKRSNGFVVDLIAGYRYALNERFITGFNVVLNKDTNKIKNIVGVPQTTATSQTEIYRQFSVVPEIMGGYIFAKQWMAYLKFGLSISRFKIDNKILAATFTINSDKTVTKIGFKPTLGLEYAMNNKASVFTDVSYEYIASFKSKLNNQNDPTQFSATDTHDVKVRPHYFTAKVGVLYKF